MNYELNRCLPPVLQVVSAVIQEDRYEVSVTVSFVSAGREEQQVRSQTPELSQRSGSKLKC